VQSAGALFLAIGICAGVAGLLGLSFRAIDRRKPPVPRPETVNQVYWILGDFVIKACWPLVGLSVVACIAGALMLAHT
jgi:hypothetical protein